MRQVLELENLRIKFKLIVFLVITLTCFTCSHAQDVPQTGWKVGTPIVSYWAGPGFPGGGGGPLSDAAAVQLKEGGWNLVWCREGELDVAKRHGLRCQITSTLLVSASLEDPQKRADLDAFIDRVRNHPALYSYFLMDEPGTGQFSGLGKLVAYLHRKDPAHLAYINLFPIYADNKQLGTIGDPVTAYQAYLNQYLKTVKPQLLSYDHYQFATKGDLPDYFLNLAIMRRTALKAGIPFLNIVQAATWTPTMREPNEAEMRYLVYTSLAYGAQGITYYVYRYPNHKPGIALPDGTTTPVYDWLKILNRDFAAIASQTQTLRSIGVFHAGMQPPGAVTFSASSGFTFYPAVSSMPFERGKRVQGLLLGLFSRGGRSSSPSMALAVNLDYEKDRKITLRGPTSLDVFDSASGEWTSAGGDSVELDLPPGGGKLVRVHSNARHTAVLPH